MPDETDAQGKQSIRAAAQARRQAQPDKDAVSELILRRALTLPEYLRATSVLFYIDVRHEVRTRPSLADALAHKACVAIPYCVQDELELFRLESLDELSRGRFGIQEPQPELRTRPEKRVAATAIDLVLVPGVSFDRRGGRLGHGRGYYDRLLQGIRPDAYRVGIAFECQLVESIPREAHDIAMDCVVTEKAVYRRRLEH